MLRLECQFPDKVRLHDHVFKQSERQLFVPYQDPLPLGTIADVDVRIGAGEVVAVHGKVVGNRTKQGAGSHFEPGAWVQLSDDDAQVLRRALALRAGDGLRATSRSFPRYRCTLPVLLEKPIQRTVQSVNISQGGVCLAAHLDVPNGQIIRMTLTFGTESLQLFGQVMWRKLEAAQTGIEFHFQNEATRARLHAQVRRIADQDPWQASARPLILVVDEEVATMKALERVLAVRGYGTVSPVTATEALSTARAELPALALIEAAGDGGGAIEICHALKHDAETSRIPVVLTSSAGEAELSRLLFVTGALAGIPKPFSFDVLEQLVSSVAEYAHDVHVAAEQSAGQSATGVELAAALVRCAYTSDELHAEVHVRNLSAKGASVVCSWGDSPGKHVRLTTTSHFPTPLVLDAVVARRHDWGVLKGGPRADLPGMQVELVGGAGLEELRRRLA